MPRLHDYFNLLLKGCEICATILAYRTALSNVRYGTALNKNVIAYYDNDMISLAQLDVCKTITIERKILKIMTNK